MDANACLLRLLEAIDKPDADTIREAAADLARWVSTGGFPPDIRRVMSNYCDSNPPTIGQVDAALAAWQDTYDGPGSDREAIRAALKAGVYAGD